MKRSRRTGFTLVELLLVIAIIGILAGLLLPAVQMARHAAWRTACGQNLGSLAEAVNLHNGAKGRLPGYQELLGGRRVAWQVILLPYMDQQTVFDKWEVAGAGAITREQAPYLANFHCPAAGTPNKNNAENNYVANVGFLPRSSLNATSDDVLDTFTNSVGKTAPIPGKPNVNVVAQWDYWDSRHIASGPFVDRVAYNKRPFSPAWRVRESDVKVSLDSSYFVDGVSNTVLCSENLNAGFWPNVQPDANGTGIPGNHGGANPEIFLPPTGFGYIYAHQQGISIPTTPSTYPATTSGNWPPAAPVVPPPPACVINGGKDVQFPPPTLVFPPSTAVNPNKPDRIEWFAPSSRHSGGVMMAYADGSTKFVSDKIGYHVYQQLLTLDSSKALAPHRTYTIQGTDLDE